MKENQEANEVGETVKTAETATNDANEPTLYGKEFFNISRHNLITGTAMRLFSAKTSAKVQEILSPINQVFEDLGGWADEIKTPANRPVDTETNNFFADARNKSHKTWHYVNLPLGATDYAEAASWGFTRETDVVQMIKECVRVLQGESNRFSEPNALRLLGHLVGDVHQPLHVGCGFIDDRDNLPKFVKDPQTIHQHNFKSDTGGNKISLPGAGKMHSYWDAGLGGLINSIELDEPQNGATELDADFTDESNLKNALIDKLYKIARQNFASKLPDAASDGGNLVTEWAEQWANDSLAVSVEAYDTLEIVEETASGYKVKWEGKAAYNDRCAKLLRNQMAHAARHLAEMLNAISEYRTKKN